MSSRGPWPFQSAIRNPQSALVGVALTLLWFCGLTQEASAYQVKRVVRQTWGMGTATEVMAVDLVNDADCDGRS